MRIAKTRKIIVLLLFLLVPGAPLLSGGAPDSGAMHTSGVDALPAQVGTSPGGGRLSLPTAGWMETVDLDVTGSAARNGQAGAFLTGEGQILGTASGPFQVAGEPDAFVVAWLDTVNDSATLWLAHDERGALVGKRLMANGIDSDGDAPLCAGDGIDDLVRAQNRCKNGTYESGSSSQAGERDAEIASSGDSCP